MSAVDLFAWREEADAAQRVAEAEAVRAQAARKLQIAPRGEVLARQARLAEATRAALVAAVELARVQSRGRP